MFRGAIPYQQLFYTEVTLQATKIRILSQFLFAQQTYNRNKKLKANRKIVQVNIKQRTCFECQKICKQATWFLT